MTQQGRVTGVGAGEAVISVTTVDGGKTAAVNVKVVDAAEGALSGEFSIGSGRKVRFSKGNLQAKYDTFGHEWSFASHQYDFIGNARGNTSIGSPETNDKVDLFGWSSVNAYYGIKDSDDDSVYSGDFLDWGTVVGDKETWFTLSKDEWAYLFGDSEERTHDRYRTGVTVCGKEHCLVIAPDDYSDPIFTSYNSYEWEQMEAYGFVCLPDAGYREANTVYQSSFSGEYWSSTSGGDNSAFIMVFDLEGRSDAGGGEEI